VQFRILSLNRFPENAVGWLKLVRTPNSYRQGARWADKPPQPSNRTVQIWNKKNAKDANDRVESFVGKRKVLKVGPSEFNIS
jgi:hypothetical protein